MKFCYVGEHLLHFYDGIFYVFGVFLGQVFVVGIKFKTSGL